MPPAAVGREPPEEVLPGSQPSKKESLTAYS